MTERVKLGRSWRLHSLKINRRTLINECINSSSLSSRNIFIHFSPNVSFIPSLFAQLTDISTDNQICALVYFITGLIASECLVWDRALIKYSIKYYTIQNTQHLVIFLTSAKLSNDLYHIVTFRLQLLISIAQIWWTGTNHIPKWWRWRAFVKQAVGNILKQRSLWLSPIRVCRSLCGMESSPVFSVLQS